MLSFFTKIFIYILALLLLKSRKALGMDNSTFNHCVNIAIRPLFGISLIMASPEMRRNYAGENDCVKMTGSIKNPSKTPKEDKNSPIVEDNELQIFSELSGTWTTQKKAKSLNQISPTIQLKNRAKTTENSFESTLRNVKKIKESSMTEEVEMKTFSEPSRIWTIQDDPNYHKQVYLETSLENISEETAKR